MIEIRDIGVDSPEWLETLRACGASPLLLPAIHLVDAEAESLRLWRMEDGGGAVACAADMALFYQCLLTNPGELWNPPVLADALGRVRVDFPDPITGAPANRGLGVVVTVHMPLEWLRILHRSARVVQQPRRLH